MAKKKNNKKKSNSSPKPQGSSTPIDHNSAEPGQPEEYEGNSTQNDEDPTKVEADEELEKQTEEFVENAQGQTDLALDGEEADISSPAREEEVEATEQAVHDAQHQLENEDPEERNIDEGPQSQLVDTTQELSSLIADGSTISQPLVAKIPVKEEIETEPQPSSNTEPHDQEETEEVETQEYTTEEQIEETTEIHERPDAKEVHQEAEKVNTTEQAGEAKGERQGEPDSTKEEIKEVGHKANDVEVTEAQVISETAAAHQDQKDQQHQPHEHPNIELLSSTAGPYSLHSLLPNLSIPYDREITAIQTYLSNIYIGTSHGEIIRYEIVNSNDSSSAPEFRLISTRHFHGSRQSPIKQIQLLPSISQAIITSASLLQVFTLPDLSHLNIGKIKDVNHISIDNDHKAKEDSNGVHVVVYTKEKIRVVNVTKNALRLVKDIAYGGVVKGFRRGEFSVVCAGAYGSGGAVTGGSGAGEYDLIDLENDGKIPLFPLKTDGDYAEENESVAKLQPFILPVSLEEFLLTCGTHPKEPSMGMIVNSDGDISRGTIPFEHYPGSLEVDDLLVLAGFDNIGLSVGNEEIAGKVLSEVVVYSIHDQSELQRFRFGISSSGNHTVNEYGHSVKVAKLSSGFKQNHDGLINLIKLVPLYGLQDTSLIERSEKELNFAQKISKIESNLVIHTNNSISLLVPKPRLERLIAQSYPRFINSESFNPSKSVKINIEELEDELKSTDSSTELGCVEIEFLNTLVALTHLKNHTYTSTVLEYFINGTIDPRILLGIVDKSAVFGDVWIFGGLVPIIENLKHEYRVLVKSGMSKMKEMNDFSKFFEKFLQKWLKKEYIENEDIIKSLQIMNLKWHIESTELSHILETTGKYDEVLDILEASGKYRSLADIYLQSGKYKEALDIYRQLIDGKLPDPRQSEEVKESTLLLIIDLVYKHFSSNDHLTEEYGKWLLKKDVNKGMNFFHNLKKGTTSTNDELIILEQIDDLGLQLEFVEKILVRLKKERNIGSLRKSLYKGLLRSR